MSKAIPIHEAKTNLSKLIQRAKKGETIPIGSYGKTEVVLKLPDEPKTGVKFGTMTDELQGIDDSVLMGIDPDVQEMFYGKDWDKQ